MTCAICGIRKARRACPGVHAEICTVCCATGREDTIDCPLTCEYLQDAHRHQKLPEIHPSELPNTDIRVSEEFLVENEMLLAFLGSTVFEAAMLTGGANDLDIRAALEGLVKTYRTLDSGIYYESVPENKYGAAIMGHVQDRLKTLREKETAEQGLATLRDAAVLGVLTFLQRLEYMENNGRPKSKSFLDFLGRFALAPVPDLDAQQPANLPEPDEPRVIL